MFSLIIAIIAIALVVATLAVGGYYGGASFLDSRARAEATRLKVEEEQILASTDLFRAEHRRWPADLQELVSTGVLRSIPRGLQADANTLRFELLPTAYAQTSLIGWTTPAANQPIYLTRDHVPVRVCRNFNLVSRGDDGILRVPYSTLRSQCFGEAGDYRIVVTNTGPDVMALKDALAMLVLDGGLPLADGGDAWWDTAPDGPVKAPVDTDKTPTALLSLSEVAIDFGLTNVGAARVRSLTLTNTGNRELTGMSAGASPEGFAIEHNSCSASLAPGAHCNLDLVFQPDAGRAYEGAVIFASSSPQPAILKLKGEGAEAVLHCSGPNGTSCSLDFGDVAVGAEKLSAVLTLANSGNQDLGGLSITLPPGYAVSGSSCGPSLANGSTCNFAVVFAPTVMGDARGLLKAGPLEFALTGRGTHLELTADIALDQDIGIGPALAYHFARYTLTNAGNLPVSLTSLAVTQGAGFASPGNCAIGSSLAPNASCSLDVGFPATQDASAVASVGAMIRTSAGDKQLKVSGSTTQLSWSVVSSPANLPLIEPLPYVLQLTNTAPTTFTFGGDAQGNGKFILTGLDWSLASSTCGATLAPAARCIVTLSLNLTEADQDRAVVLSPSGTLQDFGNRIEQPASATASKAFRAFTTSARGPRVDYSSYTVNTVNPTYAQGTANATAGNYYSLAPGGYLGSGAGTWAMGRVVTINGNKPVKAKLRYFADEGVGSLRVNDKPVETPARAAQLQESSEFTLLPGLNSIIWSHTNAEGTPSYFAVQVIKTADSSVIAPSDGWLYSGAPVAIALFHDGVVYRYTDGTVAESCQAYRVPAAGYAVAKLDGAYRIKPGASTATVYCDQTHNEGGWTLVMTNNLPNFTNRTGTGTATICLSPSGCNTGGTSAVYSGTPVEAKITSFMFTSTNDGNVFKTVNLLERPANFIRDYTPAPGISLYTLMTDGVLGWAPTSSIGVVDGGDHNELARMFGDASGRYWSDGNWWGTAGLQGMQLRSASWGHHNYQGDPVLEGANYRVLPYTHLPYFGSSDSALVSASAAQNLYRWTIFVR